MIETAFKSAILIYTYLRSIVENFLGPERVSVKNGFYRLRYRYGNRIFCVLFKRLALKKRILSIKDEKDDDVTNDVETYLGPFNNFHAIPTTPKDLGYSKLSFKLLEGKTLDFTENEIMKIE